MRPASLRGATVWADQVEPGELAALDPGVPGTLERRPDVLVVGGGILGVSVALACRDAGAGSVALIEAGRLGSGATGGAAGLLVPEAHRGVDPAALVELGRASLARWSELESTLPGGAGFIDVDWLGLAPYPEGFAADPPPAAEWLDARQVQGLVPGLTPAVPAVRVPHQGRVNPLRALSRLAAGIDQVATQCAATAVRTRAGRLIAVSTSAGVITPGSVVFATGLPPRLDGLDLRLPSDLVKGHLAVTEPVPVILPGLVAPLAMQLEDRRLLAGGTLDTDDATAEVRPEVIERIRSGVAAALPRLSGVRITHHWCCWRPHHPDGLPVIDRVPGLRNAWFTSGHFRTGILMGPATGAALAHWITAGERPAIVEPFGLDGRSFMLLDL
ncbi:MAG TPA: FAD-dependent oxidoreductase [Streptosporangiaceae bacterium]|nr:FAD-dependent oxidoreductase [Streptosporangiaceae bacterium]